MSVTIQLSSKDVGTIFGPDHDRSLELIRSLVNAAQSVQRSNHPTNHNYNYSPLTASGARHNDNDDDDCTCGSPSISSFSHRYDGSPCRSYHRVDL